MQQELMLLEAGTRDFSLDEATKERGRRGIADAKRLLAEAIERANDDSRARPGRTNRAA